MEDKRLDRLFDYTKFHIGIYLSAAGGLVTLIGLAQGESAFIGKLVGSPIALLASFIFMIIAGMAGGLIASSATASSTYEELWLNPLGPFGIKIFRGRTWASIEHGSFWLSIFLFSYSILSSNDVQKWLSS